VIKRGHKRGGLATAFFAFVFLGALPAEMVTAVFGFEPCAGPADEAVSGRIALIIPVLAVKSAATPRDQVRGHAFPDHAPARIPASVRAKIGRVRLRFRGCAIFTPV
jgi:hypothetical protein